MKKFIEMLFNMTDVKMLYKGSYISTAVSIIGLLNPLSERKNEMI